MHKLENPLSSLPAVHTCLELHVRAHPLLGQAPEWTMSRMSEDGGFSWKDSWAGSGGLGSSHTRHLLAVGWGQSQEYEECLLSMCVIIASMNNTYRRGRGAGSQRLTRRREFELNLQDRCNLKSLMWKFMFSENT